MPEEKDVTTNDVESDDGVEAHESETCKSKRLKWTNVMWANRGISNI